MSSLRRCLALACGLVLAGCANLQRFGGDVTAYNLDAEKAENQQILLNVVRSSQRQPLEFTQLQSVSGVASAGLTLTLTQPLKQYGGTTASTLAPALTASGGPTITVAVLDTQEFFQGILKPLTVQELDYYLKRGLPTRAIYSLFVSDITVRLKQPGDKEPGQPIDFRNNVEDATAFDTFQKALDALLLDKLSTKPTSSLSVEGPVMTPEEAQRSDFLPKSASAGLQVSALGWCDLDETDRHDVLLRLFPPPDAAGAGAAAARNVKAFCDAQKADPPKPDLTPLAGLPVTFYQATKSSPGFGLCLGTGVGDSKCDDGGETTAAGALGLRTSGNSALCAFIQDSRQGVCNPDTELSLALTMRSTGGVIYYLGEVTRMALYPDDYATCAEGDRAHCGRIIAVRVHTDPNARPAACAPAPGGGFSDAACEPLFEVSTGGGANRGRVQVKYGPTVYGIPPGAHRLSYDVLDIVSELIDLHRSAKDLPASNVLTVVGGH